jgi:AAA15 family ATPase/GTPase
MLKKFYANNFKCLNQLEAKSFQRCNLITGRNNVGKTTLLEALFLHEGAHNAGLAFNLATLRGITSFDNRDFLVDLFTQFKSDKEILLAAEYEDNKRLTLKIRQDRSERAIPVGFGTSETRDNKNVSPRIIFEGISEEKIISMSEVYLALDQKTGSIIPYSKGNSKMLRPVTVFVSTGFSKIDKSNLNVDRFSAQIERKRKQEIIDSLKLIDDKLINLELSRIGQLNFILGDVGFSKMVSISMMGEGIEKYLTLVLSLLTAENGILLIDEIENGFHYSIHDKLWRNLVILARKYNTQIIATTHSHEFVEAAHRSYKDDKEYDFTLHRIDMVGDRYDDVVYDKETLEASLNDNLEIR